MKKKDFIRIMNNAIKLTKSFRDGDYTCITLNQVASDFAKKEYTETNIKIRYAQTYKIDKCTSFSRLVPRDYNDSQVKQTRLAALELFKEMMLDTKGYKEIDL